MARRMTKEKDRRLRASMINKLVAKAEALGGRATVEVVQGKTLQGNVAWTTRIRTITFEENFRGLGLQHLTDAEQLSAKQICGPPEAWKR